ncbi:Sugar/inositol transporter [Macrophomina phaseolina MS6]|uniref:Sugar/inositol transporter n=1 Tax=Macrophomina phaseolina (strain MS6) TaxID=1126212 RepID=K2RKS9_MACPH|nr:Sugar/inositol transporter [Macrophomina phaseolina MS6]
MLMCEFVAAAVGVSSPGEDNVVLIAFVCLYIFFFATSWGPAAWVVIGEIFPLPIRSKGVALSTASNWFWNWSLRTSWCRRRKDYRLSKWTKCWRRQRRQPHLPGCHVTLTQMRRPGRKWPRRLAASGNVARMHRRPELRTGWSSKASVPLLRISVE